LETAAGPARSGIRLVQRDSEGVRTPLFRRLLLS
jgi:hypothetical protein